MDKDVLINKLRVIINHLPLMSSERQVLAISNANCILDAYFLTNGKFIKTYAQDCMPPNSKLNPKQAKECISGGECYPEKYCQCAGCLGPNTPEG